MVSISEAQAQVKSAKEELEGAKTQAQQRQAEINLAKAQSQQRLQRQSDIGTISSQLQLAGQVGKGGVRGEISRRRFGAREEFREVGGRISKAKVELTSFEKQLTTRGEEIVGVEKEIISAQTQQAEQQRQINLTRQARKLITEGKTLAARGDPSLQKRIRKLQALGFRSGEEIRLAGIQPTSTEIALQMSLPTGLRQLPPTEIVSGVPNAKIFAGQSIAPISKPDIKIDLSGRDFTDTQQLGGVILKTSELEQLRQQSLPPGTIGILPSESVKTFTFKDFLTTPIPLVTAVREGFFEIGTKISKEKEIIGKVLFLPSPLDISPLDIIPGHKEGREKVREGAIGGLGLVVRGASTIIPTTPVEVAIVGGLVVATIFTPPIVGGIIGGGVTALGIKGVFNPELTLEERVGSGIIGGLGAVGVVSGVTPFIRGIGGKPVTIAPEGFQTIKLGEQIEVIKLFGRTGKGEVVPRIEIGELPFKVPKQEEIGIIPRGAPARTGETAGVDLPKTSPLVRGGFEVKSFEKELFLGKDQFLTTSQRGFFEVGKDIKLEREFFVTPQEPFLKIAETRVSRLGLTDLFKFPEKVEIGFGLPPTPQIGITRGDVARREIGGSFAIGKGTELEAIRTTGIISNIERVGRTRIKGQGVDIFLFDTTPSPGLPLKGVSPKDFISTGRTTRVSGESILSSLIGARTQGLSFPTRPSLSFKSPFISRTTTTTTRDTFRISPPTTPIFPPRTPPTSPPTSPPISPPISPPVRTPRPPSLPPFDFGFEDPFKKRIVRKKIKSDRGKKRIRERLDFNFDVRLAPSFTAIVQDLRGQFPKQIKIGKVKLGISPREIRVIPN